MITYQMARQLEKAGFPFTRQSWARHYDSDIPGQGRVFKEYMTATLDELIEACGDKFERLQQNDHYGKNWSAYNFKMSDEWKKDEYRYVLGETPEEAVANLWLKINDTP